MEDGLTFTFFVFMICTLLFGTYRVGRWYERHEITKYFVSMTEQTYADGFTDGLKRCHE